MDNKRFLNYIYTMNEVAMLYDDLLDQIEVEMEAIRRATPELDHDFESLGFFCGGMYIKPIVIPAGSYLTSKVHKVEHPFFLMEGEIEIFMQDADGGVTMKPLKAPHIDISQKGVRRFGHALTNVLWVTVHLSDKTTEAEVEADVITPRENKLLTEFLMNLKLES